MVELHRMGDGSVSARYSAEPALNDSETSALHIGKRWSGVYPLINNGRLGDVPVISGVH